MLTLTHPHSQLLALTLTHTYSYSPLQEANRINKNGELVIASQKTRSQAMNIDDAIERLQEICNAAAEPPKETSPETKQRIAKLYVWYGIVWYGIALYGVVNENAPGY